MSIQFMTRHPTDTKPTAWLVSEQRIYEDEWVPTATRLDLSWIRMFLDGAQVLQEDLPEIREQLTTFRDWYLDHGDVRFREEIQRRVEALFGYLDAVSGEDDVIVWVG